MLGVGKRPLCLFAVAFVELLCLRERLYIARRGEISESIAGADGDGEDVVVRKGEGA